MSTGSGVELELADATTLKWEEYFIDSVLNMTTENVIILPNAGRSYGDISTGAISNDLRFLAGGYLLMFCYTVFMLGKINLVELRLMLSVAGNY